MSTPSHSLWSASRFESLMACPGKLVMEAGLESRSSKYAAEGTAAHQVLTWALTEDLPAAAYIGRIIMVEDYSFEVDDEMAGHVQTCVDYVQDLRGIDGALFTELKVNYSSYLDVDREDAWGTADVIVVRDEEIAVVDFKYGRGVEVSAENNPQISLYALGALQALDGVAGDFRRVRLAIHQPRIRSAASEWDCNVSDLEQWGRTEARAAVAECTAAWRTGFGQDEERWASAYLRPTETGCRFCLAKATCPALRNTVALTVADRSPATPDEFEQLEPVTSFGADWIAAALSRVDLIEEWCRAVRAEAERLLLEGETVPGWKLVAGKKGARQWSDAYAAEDLMQRYCLTPAQIYDMKLISPTSAQKLVKTGALDPDQWEALQKLVTQAEGKPHVAPETDSRPALDVRSVADDFIAV